MRPFLARVTGTPDARICIKPESDYVFLSGYGEEARGQYLRGKVRLVLRKDASVDVVELKMIKRVVFEHCDSEKWQNGKTVVHRWDFPLAQAQATCSTSFSTTYEWPFETFIPGNQKESFRGCSRCSLAYGLEGSTKSGESSHLRSYIPIRIIRCPPTSSYELMDPATSHGKWAGKVEFNASSRQQAIALGGLVPVEAQLARLEPGVRFARAKFYLLECHSVHSQSRTEFDAQRVIAEWPLTLEDQEKSLHSWQQCLQLPRMVRKCSPDFSDSGIFISHTLHFAVTLLIDNVESEYETSMPVHLFVSPELPITGWDIFAPASEEMISKDPKVLAEGIQVPPKYFEGTDCLSEYDSLPPYPPPAYTEC